MFTILDAEKSRIQSFIGKQLSNSKNELEARLFPMISGQPECIDYYQFNRILQRYTFSKEKGGFGLNKDFITQLNVTSERSPDIRESIKGNNNIKLYWLTDDVETVKTKSPTDVFQMIKKKKDFVNLLNYPVRVAISEEQIIGNDKFKLLNDMDFPKEYRLQNRISVYTEDKMFRIDFTSVKFASGKTFKQSNVITAFPCHEIEIEFIGLENASGANISKDNIFINFVKNIGLLLSIYYDTPILLTNTLKKEILDNYKLLISTDEKLKKSNRQSNKNKNKNLYNYKDFITAKPVTLHRDNMRQVKGVPNILRNYGVTYKADGMNMLLYIISKERVKDINIGGGNLFLIDSNFNVFATGILISGWDNSIVEGEYISSVHTFYAYDMLYAKNLDIRNKPLKNFSDEQTSRFTYLTDILKDINEKNESKNSPIKVSEKPYLFGNDKEIFLKSKSMWDERKSQPFHVDGLIYIPATEPYPNKPGTWTRLFKWKPPNLNSIDFLVETVKGENKRDKLFPYTEVFDNDDVKMNPYTVTQFKKLNLYSTESSDKFNRKTGKLDRKPYPKLFKEIEIPVNIQGNIISKDPLTGLSVEITDDTIVEFSYDESLHFSWVPIRVRHEKTTRYRNYNDNFGNSYNVALDIWKSIINPVTDNMITTGIIPSDSEISSVSQYALTKPNLERLPYQNFHTAYVKKRLLEMVALKPFDSEKGSGYLIDFGVCRGGDMNRWKELGYKKVVGIDTDIKCIEEAINRYQHSTDNKYNVVFLCGNLSKLIFPNQEAACDATEKITTIVNWKELMKKSLPQKYMFNVVSSQFVIHYFFSNELSLRTYLQNVTDNLKIGGNFVGTTFDGLKIYDFLKRKQHEIGLKGDNSEANTIWKITKLYGKKKFVDGKPNWGMAIDVFINTIGITHKEYLVSFKYLEIIAKEYGLELQKIIPFSELWNEGKESKNGSNKIIADIRSMSEVEKKFSFLFSCFIFKKTKNAPDSIYKKLITLKKKMDKLEKIQEIEEIESPVNTQDDYKDKVIVDDIEDRVSVEDIDDIDDRYVSDDNDDDGDDGDDSD